MTVVAVVGTRKLSNAGLKEAKLLIEALPPVFFETLPATTNAVISGGAEGIDSLVRDVWEDNIYFEEFLPEGRTWEHFKARNILIAKECDVLIRIYDKMSSTYGSGWTADYAESIGKDVYRYGVG